MAEDPRRALDFEDDVMDVLSPKRPSKPTKLNFDDVEEEDESDESEEEIPFTPERAHARKRQTNWNKEFWGTFYVDPVLRGDCVKALPAALDTSLIINQEMRESENKWYSTRGILSRATTIYNSTLVTYFREKSWVGIDKNTFSRSFNVRTSQIRSNDALGYLWIPRSFVNLTPDDVSINITGDKKVIHVLAADTADQVVYFHFFKDGLNFNDFFTVGIDSRLIGAYTKQGELSMEIGASRTIVIRIDGSTNIARGLPDDEKIFPRKRYPNLYRQYGPGNQWLNVFKITNVEAKIGEEMFSATIAQCMSCYTDAPKFMCSRCGNATYCSSACQRSDWEKHKKSCN